MYTKITELRKSWKLSEAYNLAIQEYEKDKNNVYIKWDYSWVLFDKIKYCIEKNNFLEFDNYFKEFLSLDIQSSWNIDINEMFWQQLYKFIKIQNDLNNYKILLHNYLKLKNHKPCDLHSFLLIDVLNKYKKDANFKIKFDFYAFIKLWWINNFRIEDYQEQTGKWEFEWIIFQSLFEKVLWVLWDLLKDTEDIYSIWNTKELEQFFQIWINKWYKWSKYYMWKYLLLIKDYNKAEKYIIDVTKKEKTQFWSWHLLGKILLKIWKDDLSFSALSKALSCKTEDKYLNWLREEYIWELLKRWFSIEANIELNLILLNKEQDGNKIKDSLLVLKKQDWYEKISKWDNKRFYSNHCDTVEKYLYENIVDSMIMIKFINDDKQIINFIDKNKNNWFFKYKNLKIDWIKKWDILNVKIEKFDWEYYNIYKIDDRKHKIEEMFWFENILVEHINHDKKILNFIWKNTYWFFNFSWFEWIVENLIAWNFLEVIFDSSDKEYYKVFDIRRSSKNSDSFLKKDFSWKIKINSWNHFWFVDDIFIEWYLLGNINDWDEFGWVAIRSYDKKKNKFGWKCLEKLNM